MMHPRVQRKVCQIAQVGIFAMMLAVQSGCHATRRTRIETPVIDSSTLSPVAQEVQRRGYRPIKSDLSPPTPWEVKTFRMRSKRLTSFRAEQPLPNERETYYCRFWLSEETYDSADDARRRLAGMHDRTPNGPEDDEYVSALRDGFHVGPVAYILSTDALIFMSEIQKLTTALVTSIQGAERARAFIQASPTKSLGESR